MLMIHACCPPSCIHLAAAAEIAAHALSCTFRRHHLYQHCTVLSDTAAAAPAWDTSSPLLGVPTDTMLLLLFSLQHERLHHDNSWACISQVHHGLGKPYVSDTSGQGVAEGGSESACMPLYG